MKLLVEVFWIFPRDLAWCVRQDLNLLCWRTRFGI